MSTDEFYSRPILFVSNVEASVSYYCDKFGLPYDALGAQEAVKSR